MKTIQDVTIENKEKAIIESGHDLLTIKNVNVNASNVPESSSKTALFGGDFRSCALVDIDKFIFKAVSITRQYAYGLRLGYSGTPASANGLVRIANSSISGLGPVLVDYKLTNRDGIALEYGDLWLKDTVIKDVNDACVDCKGNVKALRSQFTGAYRSIRIWPGSTVVLSNCKVDSVWFSDKTSKLVLFNTPLPTIENDSTPGIVEIAQTDPLKDEWFTGIPSPFKEQIKVQAARVFFEQSQLDYLKSL